MSIRDRDNLPGEELINQCTTEFGIDNRDRKEDKLKPKSRELSRKELERILLDDDYLKNLDDEKLKSSTLAQIAGELKDCTIDQRNPKNHHLTISQHIIKSVLNIDKNDKDALKLKMAMLLHDIGKPKVMAPSKKDPGIFVFYGHDKESAVIAEGVLNRIGYEKEFVNSVCTLVGGHELQADQLADTKNVENLLNKYGEDNLRNLFKIRKADIRAQNPNVVEKRIADVNNAERFLDQIIENRGKSVEKLKLAVNGNDLDERGLKGPEIGAELKRLEKLVKGGQVDNSREALLAEINR